MTPHPSFLAIALNRYGVSFVLMESPGVLHDWGTVGIRGHAKHAAILQAVRTLVERHRPGVLVLEGTSARRALRMRITLQALKQYAARAGVPSRVYTRSDLQALDDTHAEATKYQLNQLVAQVFPALRAQLPRKRRAWDAESYRQGVFDAAALALAYLVRECGMRLRP